MGARCGGSNHIEYSRTGNPLIKTSRVLQRSPQWYTESPSRTHPSAYGTKSQEKAATNLRREKRLDPEQALCLPTWPASLGGHPRRARGASACQAEPRPLPPAPKLPTWQMATRWPWVNLSVCQAHHGTHKVNSTLVTWHPRTQTP